MALWATDRRWGSRARRSLVVSVIAFAAAGLWVGDADAQQSPLFSVSPRFYLTWIEGSEFYEPVTVPIGGLTLSVAPIPNWDLVVNGLYGEGDSKFREAGRDRDFGFGGPGDVDVERTDVELLVRYRIPETPVFVAFGGRYVKFKEEFVLRQTTRDFFAGTVDKVLTELYFGEVGAGFATPISKDGRHSAFGSVTFGFGGFDNVEKPRNCRDASECVRRTDDGFAFLVDTNVGYQFSIVDSTSISVRYRIIAVQRDGRESDLTVVHGPELALTFRF